MELDQLSCSELCWDGMKQYWIQCVEEDKGWLVVPGHLPSAGGTLMNSV